MSSERHTTTRIMVYERQVEKDLTASDIDKECRRDGALENGYHYVIRLDGSVEAGRRSDRVGLHNANRDINETSVGILLLVSPESSGSTPVQLEALDDLVDRLNLRYCGKLDTLDIQWRVITD